MKYRTLGQGLKVSAIGIGCMPMITGGNITYGGDADPGESIKTIHKAIDLGVTFFDTAQIYGPFQNEELVGEAIKGKRDDLIIAIIQARLQRADCASDKSFGVAFVNDFSVSCTSSRGLSFFETK